jgi:hypothetical protein
MVTPLSPVLRGIWQGLFALVLLYVEGVQSVMAVGLTRNLLAIAFSHNTR